MCLCVCVCLYLPLAFWHGKANASPHEGLLSRVPRVAFEVHVWSFSVALFICLALQQLFFVRLQVLVMAMLSLRLAHLMNSYMLLLLIQEQIQVVTILLFVMVTLQIVVILPVLKEPTLQIEIFICLLRADYHQIGLNGMMCLLLVLIIL